MKEKLIELFKKIGNETDTFAPFITCDEFENLADEIVKLCNLHIVNNRRELLNSFLNWEDVLVTGHLNNQKDNYKHIDDFLKTIL